MQDLCQYLGIDPEPFAPTVEDRRKLYRLGRSKSWVRKVESHQQAQRLIQTAIKDMADLKKTRGKKWIRKDARSVAS